jgi:hypothetical protein
MRARISWWGPAIPVALVLLAASGPWATGAASASAVTCNSSWSGANEPPNPGGPSRPDILNGVTVLSSGNAWAVGSYDNGMADRTLIVHWNGSMWKVVPSPNVGGPSRENFLTGVAAISAHDIWAVGSHNNGTADRTLIMHWNGSTWKLVPSVNRGGSASENILTGVGGASGGVVWAVGKYDDGTAFQTLIEHWNGTSWATVPSPDPGGVANNNVLTGVTALSSSNAWAVGYYFKQGVAYRTLTVHWTGAGWQTAPSPNAGTPGDDNLLDAVAATPAGDIWAVGDVSDGTADRTLTERRTGSGWTVVASPNPVTGPADIDVLTGVAATSASNAWAVGTYSHNGAGRTLILHWNGSTWKTVPSPSPGGRTGESVLTGVAASAACSAWAVGFYDSAAIPAQTLALHWG